MTCCILKRNSISLPSPKKSSLRIKSYNQSKKHQIIIFVWCYWDAAQIHVYLDRGDKSHIKDSNSWIFELCDDHNVTADPTIAKVTQIASVAPTASLRLKFSETHPELHTLLVPLAERLNLTLYSMEMYFIGCPPDDNMCRYVFENCRHAQSLIYHRDTTRDFTLDPDTMGTYSFIEIDISSVPWITVEHLRKCFDNCKYVELSDTEFSAEDVNGFLKHWIEGSKIETLFLSQNDPEFEVMTDLLAGITAVSHPDVHDKTFSHIANPGYVIKNAEGIEAVIHITDGQFYLTTDFDIVDENFSGEVSLDEEKEEEDYDGED